MSTRPHILIAGGGIGGLTAAIILAQNGGHVELFERAPNLSEIGAGLQLSPNAMQVHAAIGTHADISNVGFAPEYAALRHYKTSKIHLKIPLKHTARTSFGQDYIHIHRADLQRILITAAQAAGVEFRLGTTVQNFHQTEDRITLATDCGEFMGDVLIGADGTRSALRSIINPNSAPRFTGQIAWRGTLPASAVPQGLLAPAANVWMGPGRHFVAYYLRGGELINFIAVEEREDWTEESWSLKGDTAKLRRAFDGWDSVVTQIIDATPETFLWGLFDHALLPHWTQGRAALLGDAAHPMLPFMAQGAAMATEDAWVIAHYILKAASSNASFDADLKAYEQARKPRTSKLQAISRRNAKLFHEAGMLGLALRRAKLKAANSMPTLQHMKLAPIYGVNVVKDFPIG